MDSLVRKLTAYGVGRRNLQDELFLEDKPPPRLGVYDVDDEDLCHEVIPTSCNVAGCTFKSDSLVEYENHYNATHRYSCGQCKKMLPSPHLLDLHLQEKHDSFFAVMAARKPSYSCYIEECKEKFMNPDERLDHCVKIHKLPRDFRFDQRPKITRSNKKNNSGMSMEVDVESKPLHNIFVFRNSKTRIFVKSSKKKGQSVDESNQMNIDMLDLKENIQT